MPGFWDAVIAGNAASARQGNQGAIALLRKYAASQDMSGAEGNKANDQLRQMGITDVPYQDPNRPAPGFVHELGQTLLHGGQLAGIAIGGAGLANAALGAGTAAAAGGAARAAGGGAGSVASASPSILQRAMQAIGSNPGRAISLGLGAVGTLQGAQAQGQANGYRNQALSAVDPGNAPTPDLSSTFADPGNPYTRPGLLNRAQASAAASLRSPR